MRSTVAFLTCLMLVAPVAAWAQASFDPATNNAATPPPTECQAGQVLQSNGQSCLPQVARPAPVRSTGVLGEFPNDLLQSPTSPPPSGSSRASNCQPGQALQANGQPCT
jgi:hypothetical protein